ncbi:hypothetical protein [Legionella tunisiensis]|uniref:hypothetical protein n=1 Tax=Legionella tunisiensis TaxID=1034944 RepID=UPI0002FDF8E1|nr:hypothetical protein [Legionella tunisiensis]
MKLTAETKTALSVGLSESELEEIRIIYHQHYKATLISQQKRSLVAMAEFYGQTHGYVAAKRGKIFDESETEESVWGKLKDKKKEELLGSADEEERAQIKSAFCQSFLAALKNVNYLSPLR